MDAEPTARRALVFTRGGDRLIYRAILLVAGAGFTWQLSRPPGRDWPAEIPFIVGVAALAWVVFRAGFRTRLVAHADTFEVVNLLSTHHIPFRDVRGIVLDWLTVRFELTSGRRIRAWGLPESFLASRGNRGDDLVQTLGAVVEQRQASFAPDAGYRRTRAADGWVFLAALAVFAAAVAYRELLA